MAAMKGRQCLKAGRPSTLWTRAQEKHPFPWKQKIGQSIQLLMDRHHMDSRALAKSLDIDTTVVTQWVIGHTQPAAKHLVELAIFFDVSTDWLLCRDLVGLSDDELRELKRTLPTNSRKDGPTNWRAEYQ